MPVTITARGASKREKELLDRLADSLRKKLVTRTRLAEKMKEMRSNDTAVIIGSSLAIVCGLVGCRTGYHLTSIALASTIVGIACYLKSEERLVKKMQQLVKTERMHDRDIKELVGKLKAEPFDDKSISVVIDLSMRLPEMVYEFNASGSSSLAQFCTELTKNFGDQTQEQLANTARGVTTSLRTGNGASTLTASKACGSPVKAADVKVIALGILILDHEGIEMYRNIPNDCKLAEAFEDLADTLIEEVTALMREYSRT